MAARKKHTADDTMGNVGEPNQSLQHDPSLLDPLVTAMIAKLPTHIWAKADRDKWLAMLAQVFDMVYVEPEPPAPSPSDPPPR